MCTFWKTSLKFICFCGQLCQDHYTCGSCHLLFKIKHFRCSFSLQLQTSLKFICLADSYATKKAGKHGSQIIFLTSKVKLIQFEHQHFSFVINVVNENHLQNTQFGTYFGKEEKWLIAADKPICKYL